MPDQSITIPLTQGKTAIIDAEDYERVSQFKWHASRSVNGFYARTSVHLNGMKRDIWLARFIADAPANMHVDHINHDTLDNRRSNLRVCTRAQNMANRQKHALTSSGYKGVSWSRTLKRWVAQIRCEGTNLNLGSFATEKEAACVYDAAARYYQGVFANVNFPDIEIPYDPSPKTLINRNTSGYRGVSWEKRRNKWRAQIRIAGKKTDLGYFNSAKDAANAYDVAALEQHGERARINEK